MNAEVSRFRFALRWSLSHLALSALVVGIAAGVVFVFWYPAPWRQMLGVAGIFGLVAVADLVCGPLLTLVLASPGKSRRERWLDMALVISIQLGALGYGLWSVYSARPVVVGFEVDRLVVVTANQVQVEQLNEAPPSLTTLPFAGPRWVGTRKAANSDEYFSSLQASLQGVPPTMRPGWWRPYDEVRVDVRASSKPVSLLLEQRPQDAEALKAAVASTRLPLSDLRFLPLVSSTQLDWVALLNADGEVVGYVQVDGFINPSSQAGGSADGCPDTIKSPPPRFSISSTPPSSSPGPPPCMS